MRRGASALLAVETALSALLLVATGLVTHAFLSMRLVDRGFDADRVLGMRVELPSRSYPTPASQKIFFDRLLDAVSRLPEVERVGLGYGALHPSDFTPVGRWSVPRSSGDPFEAANLRVDESFVSPGYFALMGIPLLQGEDFRPADLHVPPDAPQPAIVSRSLVSALWPDGSAMGADFQIASPTRTARYHVIGVARDVRAWGLLLPRCANCDPTLYLPLLEKRYFTDVLLRVRPGAALPTAELRAAVAHLDPGVPSDDELQSAAEHLDEFISRPRFMATIFSVIGGFAVLLVAVGLSAVVSHAVVQRTREMGIRLALGAKPGAVRHLVLLQGLRPALAGLAAGMVSALALTRYLRSLLYGLSPTDPITLASVPVMVVVIVTLAIVIPAMRASRVDPIAALRAD